MQSMVNNKRLANNPERVEPLRGSAYQGILLPRISYVVIHIFPFQGNIIIKKCNFEIKNELRIITPIKLIDYGN